MTRKTFKTCSSFHKVTNQTESQSVVVLWSLNGSQQRSRRADSDPRTRACAPEQFLSARVSSTRGFLEENIPKIAG